MCLSVYCTLQQRRSLSAVPRDSAACMGAMWSVTLRHVRGRDDRKSWNSKRPSEQRGLKIIICRERRSVRGKRILQRGHRHAAKAKRYQKYLISCLHGSLPPSLPPCLSECRGFTQGPFSREAATVTKTQLMARWRNTAKLTKETSEKNQCRLMRHIGSAAHGNLQ